jgi:hypothetical protein
MDHFTGKQVGRATLAVGQTETVLIWNDPDGSPPSQWTLVVYDPNGCSSVTWESGHEHISMPNQTLAPLAVGTNILSGTQGIYGSQVTVRLTAATNTTFSVMLIRVNQ